MSTIVRTPTFRVVLNGVTLNNVLSVSVKFDFQGRTSSATISIPVSLSQFGQWDIVEIWMGASQATSSIRFRGFLVDLDYSLWPREVGINCKGMLSLAEYHGNSAADGTMLGGMTDEAQVDFVLAACGITDKDIRGTGTIIGNVAVADAVWEEGETGLNYIDKLDEVSLGYRTFDGLGGTVIRRKVSPRPGKTAIRTFTEGVDMFNANRILSPQDVKNRVVVEGYSDEFGDVRASVIQQSPWLPPGINHITHEFSSPLIERIDENDLPNGISAKDVAVWQILKYNILREELQFDTPRGDIIAPGMTIQINSPDRLKVSARYMVQGVDISIDSSNTFTQTIRCIGGDGSTGDIDFDDGDKDDTWDDDPDWDWGGPLADFRFFVERERVIIAGVPENIYLVYAEDTSFGFTSDVVSVEWSLPGGNPATGTGSTFVSVLSSIEDAEITLTATDADDGTDTLTKKIEDSPDTEKTRPIFTAAEVAAEAFDGDVWRVQEPDNQASVSEVANGPFWIAGEKVYRSEDMLQSSPIGVIPFSDGSGGASANPTAISTELDAHEQLVYVGGSDGRLAISMDHGVTWEIVDGPKTDSVVRCSVSRFAQNHRFVMYADSFWETHDGGITWIHLQDAQEGETFRDLNLSFVRMMIVMDGGRLMIEGRSAEVQTFPEPAPTEIVAVTAHIREDKFYAISGDGRTFVTDEEGGNAMVETTVLPSGSEAQWRGLWRDGDIPGLLYLAAGTNGAWKSIDGFGSPEGYYQLRAPGLDGSPSNAIHRRVGLHGKLHDVPIPPPQGDVYLVTQGAVRVRPAPNTWEILVRVEDLPDNIGNEVFRGLASPKGYPHKLWLLTSSGIWVSDNTGQSWQKTTLPSGMSSGNVESIACKPGIENSIYIAVRQNNDAIAGTWRSTDSGQTWERILGHYYSVGAQGPNHINFSHDGSRLWVAQRINTLPGTSGTGHTIWYTDTEGEPLNSTGYGAHGQQDVWGTNDSNLAYIVRRQHVAGDAPIRVRIIGGEPERTHVTNGISDGNNNTRTIRLAVASNGTVLAVYGTGANSDQQKVFRTTNEGDSWQEVLSHPNFGGSHLHSSIASHPNNPDEFWVMGGNGLGGYVFFTQDSGDTWQQEFVTESTHRHMFVAG